MSPFLYWLARGNASYTGLGNLSIRTCRLAGHIQMAIDFLRFNACPSGANNDRWPTDMTACDFLDVRSR